MTRLPLTVVVLAVALAFASTAQAEPPAGFSESAALTARASTLAGKEASVYCATSAEAWETFVEPYSNVRGIAGGKPEAVTYFATREVHLAARICATLLRRIKGGRVPMKTLALPLFIFAHEVGHARGIRGEWQANCYAWKRLRVAARLFGVTSRLQQQRLIRALLGLGLCGR